MLAIALATMGPSNTIAGKQIRYAERHKSNAQLLSEAINDDNFGEAKKLAETRVRTAICDLWDCPLKNAVESRQPKYVNLLMDNGASPTDLVFTVTQYTCAGEFKPNALELAVIENIPDVFEEIMKRAKLTPDQKDRLATLTNCILEEQEQQRKNLLRIKANIKRAKTVKQWQVTQ